MKLALGSDHRGFLLKSHLSEMLADLGHDVIDVGTDNGNSADYPDFASVVANKVSNAEADRGILICGTGIGMAIAANKFRGVRAATCRDESTAEICRRHNDVNVLCLPGDLEQGHADDLIAIWLKTPFDGGRHERRVSKISEIEQHFCTRAGAEPSS